jgi:uncharacterized membrane protein
MRSDSSIATSEVHTPVAPSPADPPRATLPPSVWAIAAGFALAYALYALFRHWHFHTSGYDLGIFDQAIWHLSRFETPASTIAGHASIFSDHFHPILILLAPLYWVAPRPEVLLLAQSLLLAASAIPVFLYSRGRVGSRAAIAVTISYGLFWPMQKTAGFDFHEVAFAPGLIAGAILAMETRRWRWFWIAVALLVCVKEDLIPLIGMFGLRLMTLGEIRQGVAAILISIAAFAAVMKIAMPLLGGEDAYPYWESHLRAVGGGPIAVLAQIFTPVEKLRTIAMWLLPFVLLPLRSPLVLLAAPIALSRLLSASSNHWGTAFHYSAPLAPILAMAAADGLARLAAGLTPRAASMVLRTAPVLMCLLCAFLPGRLPLWRVLAPSHYQSSPADRVGYEALATIPSGASVAAQHVVVPHLSRRQAIYGLDSHTPDTDYVIVTEHRTAWPNRDFAHIRELLRQRTDRGYREIFAKEGWVVLAR